MSLTPLQLQIIDFVGHHQHSTFEQVKSHLRRHSADQLSDAIAQLIAENILLFDLDWKLITNRRAAA